MQVYLKTITEEPLPNLHAMPVPYIFSFLSWSLHSATFYNDVTNNEIFKLYRLRCRGIVYAKFVSV